MGLVGQLREIAGPKAGTTYELREVCMMGRALDCEVHIRDLTVSRRHARISHIDGRYVIEDLGSGNGTFVNDKAVTRHPLAHRDVIRVCNAVFQFEEVQRAVDAVTMIGQYTPQAIVKRMDARHSVVREDTRQLHRIKDPKEIKQLTKRLETIYAVSEAISNILDLDELLPSILERVMAVFPQAERALVMITDKDGNPIPRVVKRRSESNEAEVKVSQTIIQDVMEKREAVLSHDAMDDQRFKQGRSVANFGIRAMVAAPLIWRKETVGILYMDSMGIATFTQDDLGLLTGIAGQAAAAVGNAKLHDELLKRQRIERDLLLAERIQQSFLPRRIPKYKDYTFCARYDPAYEVGGDFYDFVRLPDERLGIVVGDVSGKGVSAALYMARLTRDIRYLAVAETDPAFVLQQMNRAVIDFGQDDIFVTLIYVVLDSKRRQLSIANAGHMPAIVRRTHEQDIAVLDRNSGLPLGVLADAEYSSDTFQLEPGDSVMLYTDGLVEAMSPSREMYGIERLTTDLGRGASGAEVMMSRSVTSCQKHVADAPQFDDTTIVCFGLNADATPATEAAKDSADRPPSGIQRARRPRPGPASRRPR